MKQPILLSLLLFATSNNFAQTTIEENKIWTVIDNWFNVSIHTSAYKFSGDTTINNIQYKKLWATGDSLLTNNWYQLSTYLREDSLHRIYKYNDNGDELLYDFSLELGDTFEINVPMNWDPCFWEVDQIDSIELNNGEHRKRLTLKRIDYPSPFPPVEYIYWVQGIGCMYSLTDFSGACNFDFSLELLCYMEDDEYLYTSPNYSACFITPINEVDLPDLKIYPNPTNGIVHIETEAQVEHLSIFDLSGKEIPVKYQGTQIDLSGFNAGVYLLKATVDGRQVVRKLVVKI